MSYLRYVARRVGFALLSVYGAVTATFLLADFMWRYRMRNVGAWAVYGGATKAEARAIMREWARERGLDEPLHVRYIEWLVDVTTLDWGRSFASDQPVVDVIAGPAATTLGYVVPGVLLAMLLGVVLGVAAALAKDSTFDLSTRVIVYGLLSFPAFAAVDYVAHALTEVGAVALAGALVTTSARAFAAVLVAVSLLAGQVRFGRASSLEQTGEPFVKLLRAKGLTRLRLARHVVRNAALPIVSMSMEIVPVLTLDVFVIEAVLPIQGFASVILAALRNGDVPVIIWSAMVFVVIAIVGNLFADVAYGYLDPRATSG